MVKLRTIQDIRKETLNALSSQDVKQIGNVLLDLVTEIESLHTECGIDQSKIGEDKLIEFNNMKGDDSVSKSEYDTLLEEYQKRFSGEYSNKVNQKETAGGEDSLRKVVEDLLNKGGVIEKEVTDETSNRSLDIFESSEE